MNKKELELLLSQIQDFASPKVKLEQYATDPSIAADILWNAFLNKDIEGKVIADLGCGPGILGLGALILGAKKVFFVDTDNDALEIAKSNLKIIQSMADDELDCEFFNDNVKDFFMKVDTVLQNPPFGVKQTHHDKLFLLKAMEVSKTIYTFHKLSTKDFIAKFTKENGFRAKKLYKYDFPIKQRFWFHMKRVKHVEVGCWLLKK